MELNCFMEKTRNAVQAFLGDGITVTLNSVSKNNGVVLEGITIMEKNKNIAPTIYLNDFWEEYEEGTSYSEIIQRILEGYERSRLEEDINMDFFLKYEQVKSRIVYKLINYSKNRELLKQVPHIPYLDLAIVFYCFVMGDRIGNATILVRNNHSGLWEVSAEELYILAEENTPRLLQWELLSMEQVIKDLLPGEGKETMGKREYPAMYVLSNRLRMNGAASILYEDLLKNVAEELGSDLYLLPSSIHEVILVPAQNQTQGSAFLEMVKEVNATQLDREEILSDSVYYYSAEKEEISMLF